MPNGTVKFFNAAKGFGFITPDDGTKDIFVPATSITAAGVASLKAGQRVSFESLPDTKGPKAVELKIIAPAPAPKPSQAAPVTGGSKSHRLTLYLDPNGEGAEDVLAELRRGGQEALVVDYMATPPSKEELKKLSLMLREGDQSAVRKYEPLFHALRLDDRFISDGEYWEAIFEHPALINGPILATAAKARVCRSKADVKLFLSTQDADGAPAKRKGLSPSLLRLINGAAAPPDAPAEKPKPKVEAAAREAAPAKTPKPEKKAAVKAVKAKAAPKPAARKPAKKVTGKSKKR